MSIITCISSVRFNKGQKGSIIYRTNDNMLKISHSGYIFKVNN